MRYKTILAASLSFLASSSLAEDVPTKPFKPVTTQDAQAVLLERGMVGYRCLLSETSLSGNLPLTAIHVFTCAQWHEEDLRRGLVLQVRFENGFNPTIEQVELVRTTTKRIRPT